MTDADALLAAVLAEPDDDGPRLVYADWLEEHDEPKRAEFIRVQLEIARIEAEIESGEDCDSPQCPACSELRSLRRRERELLIGSPTSWGANGHFSDFLSEQGHLWPGGAGDPTWEYRRGFVESVRCTLATFLAHGPAVVRCQPVTRVDVTDRSPLCGNSPTAHWSNQGVPGRSCRVLSQVYALLPSSRTTVCTYYDTEAAARDALSAALLAAVKPPAAAPPPEAGAGR